MEIDFGMQRPSDENWSQNPFSGCSHWRAIAKPTRNLVGFCFHFFIIAFRIYDRCLSNNFFNVIDFWDITRRRWLNLPLPFPFSWLYWLEFWRWGAWFLSMLLLRMPVVKPPGMLLQLARRMFTDMRNIDIAKEFRTRQIILLS